MKKIFIIVSLLFILYVLVVGYIKSDVRFYKNLLSENNLKSPDDVFKWEMKHYKRAYNEPVVSYVSPRFLIQNTNVLWCDESAIVMATLNYYLGFPTRLVDLYGDDNVSHHTVLQVYENKKWVTYDFSYHIKYEPFTPHNDLYGYKLNHPLIKPYPKLYNKIVNGNYFAKMAIFKIRGIVER